MAVQFQNFEFSFQLKGKPVFKPSELGAEIGYDVKERVEAAVEFDPYFYHLRAGGHVAALHAHRNRKAFARVDIERFFYGIGRNRVAAALVGAGIPRAGFYARWSTVRNPYENPTYALPYGFVQSPILSTLVIMKSPVGTFLRQLPASITKSVYMDDICLSADSTATLDGPFAALLDTLAQANFTVNAAKTRMPTQQMDVFNCDLSFAQSVVREDRQTEFYAEPHTALGIASFENYCSTVSKGNASDALKIG